MASDRIIPLLVAVNTTQHPLVVSAAQQFQRRDQQLRLEQAAARRQMDESLQAAPGRLWVRAQPTGGESK